jgi:hypothetical protein
MKITTINYNKCTDLPIDYGKDYRYDTINSVSMSIDNMEKTNVGFSDSLLTSFLISNTTFIYNKRYKDGYSISIIENGMNRVVTKKDSIGRMNVSYIFDYEKCIYQEIGYFDGGMEIFYCDYSQDKTCVSKTYVSGDIFETHYKQIKFSEYTKRELGLSSYCNEKNIIPIKNIEYRKSWITGNDTIIEKDIPIENYLKN